jgi:hypothetical protein
MANAPAEDKFFCFPLTAWCQGRSFAKTVNREIIDVASRKRSKTCVCRKPCVTLETETPSFLAILTSLDAQLALPRIVISDPLFKSKFTVKQQFW